MSPGTEPEQSSVTPCFYCSLSKCSRTNHHRIVPVQICPVQPGILQVIFAFMQGVFDKKPGQACLDPTGQYLANAAAASVVFGDMDQLFELSGGDVEKLLHLR